MCALFPFPDFITKKRAHTSFSFFLSWAGKFFDCPFSFDCFYIFQNMCFHFAVCPFSFLSGLGGAITQQTITQYFCTWRWGLCLEVGSALGGGIYAWVFDLCSGVLWFIAWLMFPHSFFVLEKNHVMSYFLTK